MKLLISIGLDFYYSLVSSRIEKGLPSDPVADESVFGCIICGPTSKKTPKKHQKKKKKTSKNTTTTNYTLSHTMRIKTETLNGQITKFREVELSETFEKEAFKSKTFTDQLKFDGKN